MKRNGQFVNTSLNVAPGTPLEMTIYLDDDSKPVYGLLANYLKVTDSTSRQQEMIVLNGCSIDPYIFGNFDSNDNGDSITAKFRAFKFPESNYVMFVGTVSVCLDECKGVRSLCFSNCISVNSNLPLFVRCLVEMESWHLVKENVDLHLKK